MNRVLTELSWGARPERINRWWVWVFFFALVWTLEWTWIQALTIPVRPITRHYILIPVLRACFNGLAAILIVLLIPRFGGLVAINIASGMGAVGLVAYSQYFKSPLANPESVLLLFGATGSVIPAAIWGIPSIVIWGLLVLGALKIGLLWKARPFAPGWKWRWKGTGLVVMAGGLLVCVLQFTSYSFQRIALQPFSRRVYAYGYLISWSHKAYLRSDTQKFLSRAQAEFSHYTDQGILSREETVPIGSPFLILQVESLGFEILGQRVTAGEIVPFLNHLKETSLLYRIRAFHHYGTGDMDFACLAGGHPSTDIMNYQLAGFEYPQSLPLFFKKYGYQTAAYHGNTGEFFNRRPAFQKMGFDRLGFKEDFKHLKLANSYWGIRDQDLLMHLASEATGATGRYFAFLITLDSHVPFDLIRPEEALLYPGTSDMTERYINSIHWVDRAMQIFYEALPMGTTLLIYGDHPANSKHEETRSEPGLMAEYVPVLLHRKGTDWSVRQRQRQVTLQREDLTLLDVMAYVRACIIKDVGERGNIQ